MLNVSESHSNALIVQQTGSPISVKLPRVTSESTSALSNALKQALSREAGQRKQIEIANILGKLWINIVQPIVAHLDQLPTDSYGLSLSEEGMRRIWWCLGSTLWALPIHAAGLYTAKPSATLSSRYASSYTPTISTLLRSLSRVELRKNYTQPSIIFVSEPDPGGFAPVSHGL